MNDPVSIDASLVAAVIGIPVAHSLTPAMYRVVLSRAGIPGDCGAIEVGSDDVAGFIAAACASNLVGLSVTMPLKESIVAHMDALDPMARTLMAVNCVSFSGGRATGHNTDGDGCCDALESEGSVTIEGSHAVVLGAGGTARSVALALARRGGHVTVVNRTVERAVEMVEHLAIGLDDSSGRIVVGGVDAVPSATIVVNTTSVGMNSSDSPLPGGLVSERHAVLDAVYQPMETAMLASARRSGARCIDGLWMLVHQARRQIALQFGIDADASLMRAAAEGELASRRQ